MSGKDGSVVGLISVDIGDTNLSAAFRTLIALRIQRCIIVDPYRAAKDYANQSVLSSKRIDAKFARSRSDVNVILSSPNYASIIDVMEVPPLFICQAPDLVEVMRGQRPAHARTAAIAPRYVTPGNHVGFATLTLLTHLMWSFFSLLSRGRTYRDSYAVLHAVTREGGRARMGEDRESTWRKDETAFYYALPDVDPIIHVLYMLRRESIGWRRWVMLGAYTYFISFPYWTLLWQMPPLHRLFPPQQIVVWALHGLVALVYTQHYFPGMPLQAVHAFLLPFAAPLWLLMIVYAKTFWRGYQGDAPQMAWPEMPDLGEPLLTPFFAKPGAPAVPNQMNDVVTDASE